MGLILKQDLLTNAAGNEVWVYDKTLVYNALNLGGWGTPNPNLSQNAFVAYVTRINADGIVAANPISSAISFNNADANTVQRAIGFGYIEDGHYRSNLMVLGYSADGVTTYAGHVLVTDDYFVMDEDVYKKESNSSNTKITDYSVLTSVDAITKIQGDFIFFDKLSLKNILEYYRRYRDARNQNDNDTSNELRIKMDDLKADLTGANWLFAAGLYTQAENTVEELLERHEIINPSNP